MTRKLTLCALFLFPSCLFANVTGRVINYCGNDIVAILIKSVKTKIKVQGRHIEKTQIFVRDVVNRPVLVKYLLTLPGIKRVYTECNQHSV